MFLINHRDNVTLTDDCFKWLHKLLLAAEPFQRVLSHCWGNSNNGVHAAYYTVPMRLLHSSHMKVRIWNSFTPRVRITKSGNGFHKLRGGRLENTGLKEVNDNGGSKLWEWLCVCVCVWVSEWDCEGSESVKDLHRAVKLRTKSVSWTWWWGS
jgi:hypothetical protein